MRDIKEADRRLGGTSQLIVGIIGPDFQANRRFADDLAKKLDPMVGKELRYYEYRYQDVQDYAEKYALHYLNIDQLKRLKGRLQERLQTAADSSVRRDRALRTMSPRNRPIRTNRSLKTLPTTWLLIPNVKAFFYYREAYLSAENGKVLAMTLKPQGSALGISGKQKLVDDVKALVAGLNRVLRSEDGHRLHGKRAGHASGNRDDPRRHRRNELVAGDLDSHRAVAFLLVLPGDRSAHLQFGSLAWRGPSASRSSISVI